MSAAEPVVAVPMFRDLPTERLIAGALRQHELFPVSLAAGGTAWRCRGCRFHQILASAQRHSAAQAEHQADMLMAAFDWDDGMFEGPWVESTADIGTVELHPMSGDIGDDAPRTTGGD